jgi:hypothetical protein
MRKKRKKWPQITTAFGEVSPAKRGGQISLILQFFIF